MMLLVSWVTVIEVLVFLVPPYSRLNSLLLFDCFSLEMQTTTTRNIRNYLPFDTV